MENLSIGQLLVVHLKDPVLVEQWQVPVFHKLCTGPIKHMGKYTLVRPKLVFGPQVKYSCSSIGVFFFFSSPKTFKVVMK